MNILIACHCKATHREIKIEPKKIKESDINIHFIVNLLFKLFHKQISIFF